MNDPIRGSVVLTAGRLQLELRPELGGGIARLDYVDGSFRQPILRPAAPDAPDVLGMASFPLVPYANRIRGGRFVCDGKTIELSPNLPGDPSPLHGQGWLNPWRTVFADTSTARLEFLHEAGEWPWAYLAWQDFTLDETGLSLTLGCRNLSSEPMPCGLAQHPYFPCDADTVLSTTVSKAWTADENTLPLDLVDAVGRYDLKDRHICEADLDHAFEGWSGSAEIIWPAAPVRLTLASPDAYRFHIYAPVGQNYFAAEPVQNAICGLNAPQGEWGELGIVMLSEGASHQMTMRLSVRTTD